MTRLYAPAWAARHAAASPPGTHASTPVGASQPTEERRQAGDEEWYTEEEFQRFYGNGSWKWHWERAGQQIAAPAAPAAEPPAAPAAVPGDPALAPAASGSDAAGSDAPPGPGATPGPAPTAHAAAPAPAVLQLALVPTGLGNLEFGWGRLPFFGEKLPRKAQELADLFPDHGMYTSLRAAIDGACGPLYQYLPLLTTTFTDFDVAEALGETGAIVVAEQVVRVLDVNRPDDNRVDFICYRPNGDVVRRHPGRSRKQDMKPHCMPRGSLCFHMADAAQHGVGASLHARPPGMVQWPNLPLHTHSSGAAQPGGTQPGDAQPGNPAVHLLATRAHMDQLCEYDVHMVNWGRLSKALEQVPDHYDHTEDWSDGRHFPWWVWLANKGHLRDVVNDGVAAVEVEVTNREKCVLVHSVGGVYRLSGNKVIKPLVIRSLRRGI